MPLTQMVDIAGPAGETIEKTIRFLNAPHLDVLDKVRGHPFSVTVSGKNDVDQPTPEENYEIILWKIQVKNKLEAVGQFGEECSAKIYWNFIKREGNLCWRVNEEPTKISVNTNPVSLPYIHNKFRDMIGTEYASNLQLIGETNLTIPQGENEELYFVITIKNHDYAYPITVFQPASVEPVNWSKDRRIYVKHIRDQPFYLKIGEKSKFGIRFECVGHSDRRYDQYTVEVKSWDDIDVVS
jgi:hypothetical protein